jgi:flavodoxin
MSKALVVYDSVFGNTKLVAKSIADALSTHMDALVLAVGEVEPVHLEGLSLLIVGSPTRQFRATPASMAWIQSITPNSLEGVAVAAFDTRIPEEQLKSNKILKLLSRLIAYAADPISKKLAEKGARIITKPTGFYVADTEGPMVEGELERAAEWAKSLEADIS